VQKFDGFLKIYQEGRDEKPKTTKKQSAVCPSSKR
jgi:hypothetical protein